MAKYHDVMVKIPWYGKKYHGMTKIPLYGRNTMVWLKYRGMVRIPCYGNKTMVNKTMVNFGENTMVW